MSPILIPPLPREPGVSIDTIESIADQKFAVAAQDARQLVFSEHGKDPQSLPTRFLVSSDLNLEPNSRGFIAVGDPGEGFPLEVRTDSVALSWAIAELSQRFEVALVEDSESKMQVSPTAKVVAIQLVPKQTEDLGLLKGLGNAFLQIERVMKAPWTP